VSDVPETYFRHETNKDGTFHSWSCIAADKSFAVQVWARKSPDRRIDEREWFGGVEQHATPELCRRLAADKTCSILGGRCCRDGSSDAFNREYGKVERAISSGNVASMFPRLASIFEERWNMIQEENRD
jgi:hypothetical protein